MLEPVGEPTFVCHASKRRALSNGKYKIQDKPDLGPDSSAVSKRLTVSGAGLRSGMVNEYYVLRCPSLLASTLVSVATLAM